MKAYERLLNYVKYPTASDDSSSTCPSSPEQRVLGLAIVDEMKSIGIKNAEIDDNGYVYGEIPASEGYEDSPVIGFIAHMDVVAEVPCINIKPRMIEYSGGDIILNEELGIKIDEASFPALKKLVGKHLIVTDGTTLLGADDKNGIAEILTAAEELINDPSVKHGTIKIGITPDEEIGRGADLFDIKKFGADFAYTVDGDAFGGIEYETFNAAHARVTFEGVSVHPGDAKDRMINASIVAMEFNSMLPELERPEHTEGYEGFYFVTGMKGCCDNAEIDYIIRDHDTKKLEYRVDYIHRIETELNKKYGRCVCKAETGFDYKNMRCIIEDNFHLVENANRAIEMAGGVPESKPVRGGTDGCELSFRGLPCPNLGTGGNNFHGKLEYTCIEEMDSTVEVIKNLAVLYAKK